MLTAIVINKKKSTPTSCAIWVTISAKPEPKSSSERLS